MTHHQPENERRYSGEIERLRAPERLARLHVPDVIERALAGITAQTALDIGTGSGVFAEALVSRGLSVTGIDLREDMLEAARQYVPAAQFQTAHMEALPFEDDRFDLVFMGLVLHEADDLHNALQAARRVAALRVAVLEWAYRAEDFGPPLDHRLKPDVVLAQARRAGFANVAHQMVGEMALYLLDKQNLSPWCI